MNIICDIHNHLLPGVDDGFKLREESLKAIGTMVESGCKRLTFTPHLNPDIYDNTEDKLRTVYTDFVKEIPVELGLETHLAAEYMIVNSFEQRAGEDLLCYQDGSVLIEMSYYFRSDNLENTIFELVMANHTPILAHPERYLYMVDSIKDFEHLKDMGCKLQLNAVSLTGAYGSASMHILNHLFDAHFYDYIATDLHSIRQLESILSFRPRSTYRKELERLLENSL